MKTENKKSGKNENTGFIFSAFLSVDIPPQLH